MLLLIAGADEESTVVASGDGVRMSSFVVVVADTPSSSLVVVPMGSLGNAKLWSLCRESMLPVAMVADLPGNLLVEKDSLGPYHRLSTKNILKPC